MFFKGNRNWSIAAALVVLSLALATPASATTLGSNLQASPNAGVCATDSAVELSCTYMQLARPAENRAPGSGMTLEPAERAVITAWQVSSGPATTATTSVKLRLRLTGFVRTMRAFGGSSLVELPLADPGIHRFPARLPIDSAKQPVLDVHVTGNGVGEATAPIAHLSGEEAAAVKWSPSLVAGKPTPKPAGSEDVDLLFNVVVESDRDRDGYGDRTQDRCPRDPERHARCDRVPPRTHRFAVDDGATRAARPRQSS